MRIWGEGIVQYTCCRSICPSYIVHRAPCRYIDAIVHFQSRSKRSAEDQQSDEATYVSTYAAHPYPLTYTAGYPYTTYSAATAVYSAANSAVTYSAGYPFGSPFASPYRYFY